MRKIWDIHGGVHPPENKTQSINLPIGDIPLPNQVILPLNQHIGAPAKPIVEVGEHVKCGQLIASADGFVSAPVHASVSGTVSAIEDRLIPHSSGMTAPCIVITADGNDDWVELQACENFEILSHDELVAKVREAGIAGLGGAGFPTSVKLNPRGKISTLILNGTECEPYITADDMLMREHADEVIAGALLIAKIVGEPSEILIGVEDNKPVAIEALKKAAENTKVEVVVFPTKYPSGGEKQLIQILTGKEVGSGTIPADLGIVVQNVGTAVAIWQAVRYGKPLVERVTTVVGESLDTQRNIRVRLGTPLKHILDEHGFDEQSCARLIIGGPMMGYTVDTTDIPLVKTTNCVLVPSDEEMPEAPEAQPCIRCGHCAEACPASLLPQQLYWYAQSHDHEKLEAHNIFDCIECGACSFVCPSAIPLVQYYRAAKGELRQAQADKIKSDRARERFEARKERMEKLEAEKEAKRIARQKAAEEARKKKEAAANVAPSTPAVDKEKLEKTIVSLENRIAVTQEQIDKAKTDGDDDKAQRLSTKLEASQKKLAETKEQLANPNTSSTTTTSADPVAAAVSRALNKNISRAEEKAKLERTLSSLENRISVMKEQIETAEKEGDADKVNKLQAKLKQSEVKLEDTKNKISQVGQAKPASDDPVAAAIARAQSSKPNTEEEKAKLERTENSLINRIEVMKDQIAKAQSENDQSKVDKLTAKLKQSEIKLREVKSKISQLAKSPSESQTLEKEETKSAATSITAPSGKDEEREKVERTISSLEKRLEVMAEQIETAKASNDEEKVAKLSAKMEQGQKKLNEFKDQL